MPIGTTEDGEAVAGTLGAYGLRFTGGGIEGVREALVPVAASSPHVALDIRLASSTRGEQEVTPTRMVRAHVRGVRTELLRHESRAVLDMPDVVTPEALLHPVLTMIASIFNRWHGRVALHGGAFAHDDRAIGVLGHRTDGKSSLLAGLSRRGVDILTDDLIVVDDDGLVLTGPGSVDLRPEAGAALSMGRDLGVVGGRARQRLSLPQRPPDTVLGGFIQLAWADDDQIRVERLPLAARLPAFVEQELLMGLASPAASFPLLELPMWRLTRPKDWSRFEDSLDVVLDTVKAGAA